MSNKIGGLCGILDDDKEKNKAGQGLPWWSSG